MKKEGERYLSRESMVFTFANLPTSRRKSRRETPTVQSWLFTTPSLPSEAFPPSDLSARRDRT